MVKADMFGGTRNRLLPKLAKRRENSIHPMSAPNSGNGGKLHHVGNPQKDLQELNKAIDRIEELIRQPLKSPSSTGQSSNSTKATPEKSPADSHSAKTTMKNGGELNSSISHVDDRSSDSSIVAKFVQFSRVEEEELVELIRRIAELVVQGERRAAAVEKWHEKSPSSVPVSLESSQVQSPNRGFRRFSSSRSLGNAPLVQATDSKEEQEEDDEQQSQAAIEKERQAHSALFDKFLERNVLSLFVNIATGVSFAAIAVKGPDTPSMEDPEHINNITEQRSNSPDPNTSKNETVFLPPLAVATQAVQSIAILLQNVSQATSLYLLLSNNRVNDLIELPMDLYAIASSQPRKIAHWDSAEMSELATHFVSFLKSLVVRINSETLQFFIRYATDKTVHMSSKEDGHMLGQEVEDANTSPSDFVPEKIEFPLYARALEFCGADQDSFVRLTAMNICLNTLRLAAVVVTSTHTQESNSALVKDLTVPASATKNNLLESSKTIREQLISDKHDYELDQSCFEEEYKEDRPDQLKSPDANLELVNLPFRERVSIAHHICNPAKVQRFVGHIFVKLIELFSNLQETFQALEVILSEGLVADDDSEVSAEVQARHKKLSEAVMDIAADLQDELMLLDDIMKMGLTALNEQIIEMMLASFIYPILLEPLLVCVRCKGRMSFAEDLPANSNGSKYSQIPGGHPFFSAVSQLVSTGHASNPVPAKTSLFGFYAIFNTLSNTPLRRLLFAALLHPMSPETSLCKTNRIAPSVITVENGMVCLRVDPLDGQAKHALYDFGRKNALECDAVVGEECIFVLAPALAALVDSTFTDGKPNPYREIILTCISGQEYMGLQHVSTLAFDAALSSLGDEVCSILRGADDLKPLHRVNSPDHSDLMGLEDVIEASCLSVISSTVCVNGLWRLDYNKTAVHSLLMLLRLSPSHMNNVLEILSQRMKKAAYYVCQIPSSIEYLRQKDASACADEQMQDLLMDRLIRDSINEEDVSALNRLKRRGGNNKDLLFVTISRRCTLNKAAKTVCQTSCSHSREFTTDDLEATMACAVLSISAYFHFDALFRYTKEVVDTKEEISLVNVDTSEVDSAVSAPISCSLSDALYDEQEDISSPTCPRPGAVVGLVGRVAFPCVCEVSKPSENLFTDQRACVVADGVKWQSLYLVFLGRYMLLAEPVKQGSGGTGRIVTSCHLSCLSVVKDKAPKSKSASSARRLILKYESLTETPPGVFNKRNATGKSVLIRSRMDLWFENDAAADIAFETFNTKIIKAKAKRGKHLRAALSAISLKI